MDAIAARAATDSYYQVARHRLLFNLVDRDDADVSAVHKWISKVAVVKVYSTIDRRDAHAIAIVSDARHDPFHDATRMQYRRRQIVRVKVGGCKAENVRAANWFCTQSRIAIRPGNLGNGSVRGPATWSTDISLAKNFRVTEKSNLQFRADMFNATNHVNYGGPAAGLNSAVFGQISGAGGMRVVQLNAKFRF